MYIICKKQIIDLEFFQQSLLLYTKTGQTRFAAKLSRF